MISRQRKRGSYRLLELLRENLSHYFLSGLIALAGATLYGAAVWAAAISRSILVTLLAGMAAGVLLGPCLCGLCDTILRTLRDMPGNWGETYRRAWKQNTRQSIPFGVVMGFILSGQIFALRFGLYGHPLKTLSAVLVVGAWALLLWLLLPLSAILWAIGGLWFPALLVLYLLSGLLEDSFHAEATLSTPPEKHDE